MTTTAELYDPVTQTFTPTGSTSHTFREVFAVRLQDGRVLVAGGRCCASTGESNAEVYNPATGTWAVTGSLDQARTGYTLTLLPTVTRSVGAYTYTVQATDRYGQSSTDSVNVTRAVAHRPAGSDGSDRSDRTGGRDWTRWSARFDWSTGRDRSDGHTG